METIIENRGISIAPGTIEYVENQC